MIIFIQIHYFFYFFRIKIFINMIEFKDICFSQCLFDAQFVFDCHLYYKFIYLFPFVIKMDVLIVVNV